MPLPRDTYRELEDILGPENISDDPVVLETYAYVGQHSAAFPGADPKYRYHQKAEAILLPGSTADVQAIVKLCNRRGVNYKAFSTGYGQGIILGRENTVILDLRRMNRILELDAKNMYIVVEPYVSFAQVQAEIMKCGLNSNIVGAGSQPSYLASFTSVGGNNSQCISQGYSGRNLLAAEWVLPTGEILRVGTLGSGCGWFSGDGPGPSLRGIIRGSGGAGGGLGVFTKCSGHLHPWWGGPDMDVRGISPYYGAEVPPLFEYHVLDWPTWAQAGDAMRRIGEADIGYAMHKTGGPGSHGACVTGNNNEYYEKRQAGEMELPRVSFAIVTSACTPAQHEYQVKTLDKILVDTGGKITPVGEEPNWKRSDYIGMLKACHIPRLAFRCSGNFAVDGLVGTESIEHCMIALGLDEPHRDRYAEKGILMDDGTLNSWGAPYEGTHFGLYEAGHVYNPQDDASCQGMMQMAIDGQQIAVKNTLAGIPLGPFEGSENVGPNFRGWLRAIKAALDPDERADPLGYVSAKE